MHVGQARIGIWWAWPIPDERRRSGLADGTGEQPIVTDGAEAARQDMEQEAADVAEAKRKKEREEEWERYLRQEDARKTAQALADSREQLAEIIDRWGRAMTIERFFMDAEERLKSANEERRQRLEERLNLARAMMESVDPLDFVESWVAPEERHRSKYA